jgi:hypothetical protein
LQFPDLLIQLGFQFLLGIGHRHRYKRARAA